MQNHFGQALEKIFGQETSARPPPPPPPQKKNGTGPIGLCVCVCRTATFVHALSMNILWTILVSYTVTHLCIVLGLSESKLFLTHS